MSLDSDIQLLSRVPLFCDLAPDQLRLLVFSAIRRDLAAGEVLFRRGDVAVSGYLVADGSIELAAGEGETQRVVETCGRGFLIGELPLFVPGRRRATATASEPTAILELTRETVARMLTEYPEAAVRIRDRLADRLGRTIGDLRDVREKLAAIDPAG